MAQQQSDTSKLTVTLQVSEWNQILAVLADAPYRIVAPLIAQITAQAQEPQGLVGQDRAPLPNGSDAVNFSN
jgi:hypothetical protein